VSARRTRRFFAPEIIQTSGMDCGPAVLESLLSGFRISASYDRLRDACQTDVDGTSIDTLEELAQQAGLKAEQVMLPLDHVLSAASPNFPAIAVVRNASGGAHFVLAWRRHGPFVQVMDPSRGRLWLSTPSFLNQLVVHSMRVPSAAWRKWAGSESFLAPFRERLAALGVDASDATRRVDAGLADPGWRSIARLDAVTRMVTALQESGAVSRRKAPVLLAGLLAGDANEDDAAIPESYWSVQAVPGDGERLNLRGVVLVRVRVGEATVADTGAAAPKRSKALSAALNEAAARPFRDFWPLVRRNGLLTPAVAALALSLAVVATVFEAALLRSVVDIGAMLTRTEQRIAAGLALVVFGAALLCLELLLAAAERRMGLTLEGRLRIALLGKIPRLEHAYFRSRPISDMLERSHALHTVRMLPRLSVRGLRIAFELIVTAGALIWIQPATFTLAIVAAAAAAAIPWLGHSAMAERDLRARTHAGALARFHLDALLGRTAIEAHGAGPTIEREHEALLVEWVRALHSLQRAALGVEGVQMIVGFGLAAWMVLGQTSTVDNPTVLLQVYWMLNLPALGYELALIAREYPGHRSTLLRLLEPLSAPAAASTADVDPAAALPDTSRRGVTIDATQISVQVSGHAILEHVDLHIASGTHVAIVGSSGAGKSTLVGLLLGWHQPAAGQLMVDGAVLDAAANCRLRADTAWVDPTVQVWNRPLLENLTYGSDNVEDLGTVLEAAGLLPVVARLPQGLATPLGEGGSLLSAGEAQRVRFARAMLRRDPRLVVLDEPFVGLERDRRRTLLVRARQHWRDSTMLYVTHDLAETRAFDRVVVLEHGRIVEDGHPLHLAQMAASRYRRLLLSHEASVSRFNRGLDWRRIRLDRGRIVQDHANSAEQSA
jgi:ATP-binding cassette subfamily B protein